MEPCSSQHLHSDRTLCLWISVVAGGVVACRLRTVGRQLRERYDHVQFFARDVAMHIRFLPSVLLAQHLAIERLDVDEVVFVCANVDTAFLRGAS